MKWQSKLTKAELKHLKAADCKTLQHIKDTRAWQKNLDPDREVCWDCRSIAIKLGIEK